MSIAGIITRGYGVSVASVVSRGYTGGAVPPVNLHDWVPPYPHAPTGRQVAPALQRLRENAAMLGQYRLGEPGLQKFRKAMAGLGQHRTVAPSLKLIRKNPPTLT